MMSQVFSAPLRGLAMASLVTVALGATTSLAQEDPVQAGVAAGVRGDVQLARAYEGIVGRRLDSGEAIFLEDVISAGPDAAMQILLMDETVFTIGANSQIIIDEFVYDPETSVGKISAQIVKGAFRFTTGLVGQEYPDSVSIGTPMGTIGIRGTIVAGEVGGTEALIVLIGPGDEAGTKERVGRIEVGNDAGSVEISRSGYGTTMGIGVAPTPPVAIPQARIDGILASVQGAGSGDGSDTPDEGDTAATSETDDDSDSESDDQTASAADGEAESETEAAVENEAESETSASTETNAPGATSTSPSTDGTASVSSDVESTTLTASVGGTSLASLSGGLIATAAGDAGTLETVVDGGGESSDTIASAAESTTLVAGTTTTLGDITQITTGTAISSGNGTLTGTLGSSGTFDYTATLDFGSQTARFVIGDANWGGGPNNGSFSLDAGPENFTTIFSDEGRTPSNTDTFSSFDGGALLPFDSNDNTGDFSTPDVNERYVVKLEILNRGGQVANASRVEVTITDNGETISGEVTAN